MVTATGPIPPLTSVEPTARIDQPTAHADEVGAAAPSSPIAESGGSDVAELSRLGPLLGRLPDLQQTDPRQAQRALLAMESELAGRAEMSGGDAELHAL